MTPLTDREQQWWDNQERGWVSYGLREVVVERMLPDLMQVETTSLCNLRCVFCPYDEMSRNKQHMDLDEFRDLLQEQAGHVKSIGLHHFGEPFLNPDLPAYVQICTDLGIETTVSTNATWISVAQAEAVVNARLTRLIVSLDAVDAASYERLRVGGRYDRVLANLGNFLTSKERLGGTTFVQVQFIATPENDGTWPAFREMWTSTPGVDQVIFRNERSHAGQRVRHDSYQVRDGDRLPCRYLWESLVVLADGRVVPCCKDFDGKEVLGNVFDGDRLADIWNGPRMSALRRAHVDSEFDRLPLCGSCTEWPGHGPKPPAASRAAFKQFRAAKAAGRVRPVHRRDFE